MDGSELDTASIQYFGLKTVAFVTHCSHLLCPLRSVAIFPHQIKDNKIFHDSCLNISHQEVQNSHNYPWYQFSNVLEQFPYYNHKDVAGKEALQKKALSIHHS